MEIAMKNDLPVLSLVQSVRLPILIELIYQAVTSQAGVVLPQQFKVFHKGGMLFHDLSVRTQKGQASCAVVFGSCTAGGACMFAPSL
jgi:acetyl-CoA carboxylase carboxyltransferase component